MHYFASRAAAGDLLADQLEPKYRYEDCAVVGLSDGGVVVGAQIAVRLHCVLTLLLSAPINLAGEPDAIATVNQEGTTTYDDRYSNGELEEIKAENFNYIEGQKLEKVFEMNRLLGDGGLISRNLLQGRNIILVSDGLASGMSLAAAVEFLKPVQFKRLIVATPFASVPAVDKMHILADEIVCLNVLEDMFPVEHYYESNSLPSHEKIVEVIEHIILHWK
jgi:predicted phosphoribosyltransferase